MAVLLSAWAKWAGDRAWLVGEVGGWWPGVGGAPKPEALNQCDAVAAQFAKNALSLTFAV